MQMMPDNVEEQTRMSSERRGTPGAFWLICGLIAGTAFTLFFAHYFGQSNAVPARHEKLVSNAGSVKRVPSHVMKLASKSLLAPLATSRSTNSGTAGIPPKWQFEGIAETRTGPNDSAWLSSYPVADLSIFQQFNQLHPYAWNAYSSDQISWMAENGFPMPEDVLAAADMSDSNLKQASDSGGMKANFLYYDRLLSNYNVARDEYKQTGGSAEDFEATHQDLFGEMDRLRKLVEQSDSPYLGYLETESAMWQGNHENFVQGMMGGLALAYFRGDDRAGNAILAMAANGDATDREAALAYRIVSQLRNYYRLPEGCGPASSTPFPRITYP